MSPAGRALVLGATGHIGQAMVRELLARGHRVTAATRRERPAALEGLAVEVAPGDADAPGQLEAWVRGHGLVVDAAAPYPVGLFSGGRDPLEHARARTERLIDAVARHGARLGFVSSFTTLPRPEVGLGALEARWRRRLHPYFAVKALMESMVRAAARRGLPAVIVNPTACLGPWDGRPEQEALIPQLLAGAVPAMARREVNVIDVRDVAAGLCAALEAERYGEPIPLSGHDVRTDLLCRRICELASVPPPPLPASARLAAWTLLWTEAAWAAAGRQSPLPSLWALLLCDSHPMRPGAAQRELGLAPRPLDQTLADAIAWYRGRGLG